MLGMTKTSRSMRLLCTVLFATCLCVITRAEILRLPAQEIPELKLAQPIANTLKDGEAHKYKLRAEARTLVRVRVMQLGVNVAVSALDGSGRRLATFDDYYGRVGEQLLEFIAETGGDYLVQVKGRTDESGGAYEITYLGSRTANGEDRTRLAANSHLFAGRQLRGNPSPERNRAALAEYEQARTQYKQINDRSGQAMALEHIARVYEGQSSYTKALESYSSALVLSRQAKHRRGEAFALMRMGSMNTFLGNLDAALSQLREAGEIHRETGDKEGEALTYHETANIYVQKGDVGKGLEYFHRALSLYREVGATGVIGYLLSNMGEAYRSLGDLKSAADYQNQALEIWREQNQRHGLATGTIYLGAIYSELGETRRAISSYQEAARLCSALEEKDCEARSYNFLAAAHASLGELQTALDYYAKSAEIYRQRGQILGVIRMLNSAGALYASLGEKQRARQFFNEALASSRKAQSRIDEATALTNLAEIDRDDGHPDLARRSYEQALAIDSEIKNRVGEATTLNRLGVIATSAGRRNEAIKMFEQALSLNRELRTKPDEAFTLNNLGVAHDAAGDAKAALEDFTKALTLFREVENKSGEAMMLYRVATVLKELGKTNQARDNITAALAIIETIRGKIGSVELRSSYFATVQQYYDLYVDLLMREHRARPQQAFDVLALQASEQARARSLLDLLQEAKADLRQGVDAKLLAREKELEELVSGKTAQQEQAFSDPKKRELAKTLGEDLNALTLEYETLQGRIRESNPRYAELLKARPLLLMELQRLLDPETILLEYKLGEVRSYLWAVSQTKIESYELPPRAEIERDARRVYEQLTERNRALPNETVPQRHTRIQAADNAARELSQRLGKILLEPATSSFSPKRMVIVADGALQYVPFAAIAQSPSGQSISKDGAALREIVLLPSIGALAELGRRTGKEQQPMKSVAVFADPVLESDDPRLPRAVHRRPRKSESALTQSRTDFGFASNGLPRLIASREEARAITSLAPAGSSYAALDFDANREHVTNESLSAYRVLHFATHALLNTQHPQLSGIVLSLYDAKGKPADGFLRLNHIFGLRLSNDLVVLSACSTALGKDVKGEGLIGLTRGFMYAGVRRVIGSLWKVDDEATAEFMKLFYRNLLRKNMPASMALNAAQSEMQIQQRWRSPYYWAAFTLHGDWR